MRYKQSVMGLGWAVFVPFTNMVVFTVIFTRVVPLETSVPYPLFAYAGLLAWNWLASSVQFATSSLTGNMALVTKVYFPRAVFPVSAVAVAWVDFVVASSLLVVLMLAYGVAPAPTAVLIPVVMVIQLALVLAVSLVAALGNVFFRDVRYLVTVLVPLWMFATPVVYPLEAADPSLQRILRLNPATPIVEAYRDLLFAGRLPPLGPLLATAAVSCLALAFAWRLHHRLEPRFAEMI